MFGVVVCSFYVLPLIATQREKPSTGTLMHKHIKHVYGWLMIIKISRAILSVEGANIRVFFMHPLAFGLNGMTPFINIGFVHVDMNLVSSFTN